VNLTRAFTLTRPNSIAADERNEIGHEQTPADLFEHRLRARRLLRTALIPCRGPVIQLPPSASSGVSLMLDAVGSTRVVALIGSYSSILAEEVDPSGQIIASSRVSRGLHDNYLDAASNGTKIVAAWPNADAGGPDFSSVWSHGHWLPPTRLGTCTTECPTLGGLAIDPEGQASALLNIPGPAGSGVEATFGP
jgi:hypothetical protein